MIKEIQDYCRETHQKIPHTAGELACCIYTNLAIIYAIAIKDLEQITGRPIQQLHIVGGGAHNDLLNQLTADMCGKTVYAGPGGSDGNWKSAHANDCIKRNTGPKTSTPVGKELI